MKLEAWVGAKVGDRVVTNAERAETPLSGTGRGGLIYYRKAATLTLEGGSSLFGCLWDDCEYTSDNVTSLVSGHWKVHEVKPDLRRVPYGDWTLVQILGRLTDVEADFDKAIAARDRALDAHQASRDVIAGLRADVARLEKELAAIRGTFKSLAGM